MESYRSILDSFTYRQSTKDVRQKHRFSDLHLPLVQHCPNLENPSPLPDIWHIFLKKLYIARKKTKGMFLVKCKPFLQHKMTI